MRIGIVTYHRAENYGAMLQAYALMTYLRNLGHEVEFIDYWPEYFQRYHKIFNFSEFKKKNIKGKAFMLYQLLKKGPARWQRKGKFHKFQKKHLGLSDNIKYPSRNVSVNEKYDAVIYGSDQIWRKQTSISDIKFDDWYFGAHQLPGTNIIAYAASMGEVNLDYEEKKEIERLLTNFDHISVRENDLNQLINDKLGLESQHVCDPVFLLNKREWNALVDKNRNSKSDYIFVYNLLNNEETRRFAESLSKETGCEIHEVNLSPKITGHKRHVLRTLSVSDFLGELANAKYIVSNSFHGVALSVVFRKNFFAVSMGKKAPRVVSLLNELGLERRYFETLPIDVVRVARENIWIEGAETRVNAYIQRSTKYLKDSMK